MTETITPRWDVKRDAFRQYGFGDLIPVLNHQYHTYESLYAFLGPYNARQRSSGLPYLAPDKNQLRVNVRQGGMNEFAYEAMLAATIQFCERTKGLRGLPEPHPSTIHSIQLPQQAFELKPAGPNGTILRIAGVDEPITLPHIAGAAHSTFKFAIVRPKLSKLGTASASSWEVLLFRTPYGYIPDWTDSMINPRWSGRY